MPSEQQPGLTKQKRSTSRESAYWVFRTLGPATVALIGIPGAFLATFLNNEFGWTMLFGSIAVGYCFTMLAVVLR